MEKGTGDSPMIAVVLLAGLGVHYLTIFGVPRFRRHLLSHSSSHMVLPWWSRARTVVPLFVVLYLGVPVIRCFTPTECGSLPWYLEGGNDWGGMNVFAITKILFWCALYVGSVAGTVAVRGRALPPSQQFRALLRCYAWHGFFQSGEALAEPLRRRSGRSPTQNTRRSLLWRDGLRAVRKGSAGASVVSFRGVRLLDQSCAFGLNGCVPTNCGACWRHGK